MPNDQHPKLSRRKFSGMVGGALAFPGIVRGPDGAPRDHVTLDVRGRSVVVEEHLGDQEVLSARVVLES